MLNNKLLFLSILLSFVVSAVAANPKREFRGAWISTVYQDQYHRNTTDQNKRYITSMLDSLQAAGVNAVLFQARPSADAFYDSRLEPWSRFLTDGGKAPQPMWDPLAFIIDEAHARGMELHAWLNPYRVTTSPKEVLPEGHIYHRHPERFIRYEGDGKIYFDPALPENRRFIVDVVKDIVERYDVDGIHFDDYFYPYPAKGKPFADDASFKKYGAGQKLADWRRGNVDKLIEMVSAAIRQSSKPWVRFGISPFGIHRNKSTDTKGSDTNGLQNYDDLYADVLLWAENGWIDYLLPQLYWQLDHPRASYLALVDWWPAAVPDGCQLYIGQCIDWIMNTPDAHTGEPNELSHKIRLTRDNDKIQGNCWWPAYDLIPDKFGCARQLRTDAQSTVALVPAYPRLWGKRPAGVTDIRRVDGTLAWTAAKRQGKASDQAMYVVYRLPRAEAALIDNPEYIVAVTSRTSIPVDAPGIYTVTALDHVNNESKPAAFLEVW